MTLNSLNFVRYFKASPKKSYISELYVKKKIRYYSSTIYKLTESYYQTPSLKPLIGKTLGTVLHDTVEKFANKPAIISSYQNIQKTFQQLHEESDKLAASLLDIGLEKGDHLAIIVPNCYEWVVTELACVKAGIVLVAINIAYQVPEIEYCLTKTKCKAIIMSHKFITQNYYEMLCKITGNLHTSTPGQLNSERTPDLKIVILMSAEKMPGTLSFQELMEKRTSQADKILQDVQKLIQFDDTAFILLTSGTTGQSKAASISHHSVVNNMDFFGANIGFTPETIISSPVPMFHIFGCLASVFMPFIFGSCVVLPSERFDPLLLIKTVSEKKCTTLFGTPTMIFDTLNHPENTKDTLSTLNLCLTGAAPVPEKLVKLMMKYVANIIVAYGSTETLATFMTVATDPPDKILTTVGRPLPHTEVKIVDPEGRIVPINKAGEIWTRNYGTMLGYYNDKNKTKEAITESRWYKTGDIGCLDEDGFLTIKSRIKDMIIRGGTNIYPAELEHQLNTHPKIKDVQVCGVPDERLGEEVCAWVRIKPGKSLTEQEIRDFCKGQMAHFKIPRYILFVEEFPLNQTGKVQKFKMKERSIKMLDLKEEK